jgi:hypothetical protein
MASCSCCSSDIDLFLSGSLATIGDCSTHDEMLPSTLELDADDIAIALSGTATLGSLLVLALRLTSTPV